MTTVLSSSSPPGPDQLPRPAPSPQAAKFYHDEIEKLSTIAELATALVEDMLPDAGGVFCYCGEPGVVVQLRLKLERAGYLVE